MKAFGSGVLSEKEHTFTSKIQNVEDNEKLKF